MIHIKTSSLEAMSHQDEAWFNEFVERLGKITNVPIDKVHKVIKDTNLAEWILKTRGVRCKFVIDKTPEVNAAVMIPILRKDSIMYDDSSRKAMAKEPRLLATARKKFKDGVGIVDRHNGMLKGFYTQIEHTIYLTEGAINVVETDELAAALSHEIGHVYSIYETLEKTRTTNLVIEQAAREFSASNPTNNEKVIKDLETKLNIKLSKSKDITGIIDDGKAKTLLITEAVNEVTSTVAFGQYYNVSAFEQSADQFVSRLGAAVPLAKGLAKINNHTGNSDLFQASTLRLADLFILLLMVVNPFFLVGKILFYWIWLGNGHNRTVVYDNPEVRVKRLREDVISRLKDKSLSKESVKHCLAQIDELTKLSDDARGGELLFTKFYKLIFSRKDQASTERQLEELIANDLYVNAARAAFLKN